LADFEVVGQEVFGDAEFALQAGVAFGKGYVFAFAPICHHFIDEFFVNGGFGEGVEHHFVGFRLQFECNQDFFVCCIGAPNYYFVLHKKDSVRVEGRRWERGGKVELPANASFVLP
jgi:hypothetical protein